jgi:hypothetical protein
VFSRRSQVLTRLFAMTPSPNPSEPCRPRHDTDSAASHAATQLDDWRSTSLDAAQLVALLIDRVQSDSNARMSKM